MDKTIRPQKSAASEYTVSIVLFLYSIIVMFLLNIFRLIAPLSPRIASQLEGRSDIRDSSLHLARLRSRKSKCVVFFCSSSGEFEQAKPLIDRLNKSGKCFTHVFFFSRSGFDYARARKETVSFSLSPVDTVWNWGWVLSALRPDCSIVVRHEWWPGFLATAHAWNPVWLIDAVDNQDNEKHKKGLVAKIRQISRRWLARFFDRIYVVDEKDLDAFTKALGRPAPITSPVGDTKYDRVLERSREVNTDAALLTKKITENFPGRNFIAGSIYSEDLDVLIPAFTDVLSGCNDWNLILVPHHPKLEFVDGIKRRLAAAGLHSIKLSELANSGLTTAPGKTRAIVVDSMGQLAELYRIGELAYVGGAMHAKIHNVLEPATHGLALASGPQYKNSREAIRLQHDGVLTAIKTKDELSTWWKLAAKNGNEVRLSINKKVADLCGASDILFVALEELLFRNPRTD